MATTETRSISIKIICVPPIWHARGLVTMDLGGKKCNIRLHTMSDYPRPIMPVIGNWENQFDNLYVLKMMASFGLNYDETVDFFSAIHADSGAVDCTYTVTPDGIY